MMLTSFSLLFICVPLLSLSLTTHQTLQCLLYLETTMLALIAYIFYLSLPSHLNTPLILTSLTLAACGAGLSLACLTSLLRTNGNDHITSLLPHKF